MPDTNKKHPIQETAMLDYSLYYDTSKKVSHIETHDSPYEETPYTCTVCGEGFNRNDKMKSHM